MIRTRRKDNYLRYQVPGISWSQWAWLPHAQISTGPSTPSLSTLDSGNHFEDTLWVPVMSALMVQWTLGFWIFVAQIHVGEPRGTWKRWQVSIPNPMLCADLDSRGLYRERAILEVLHFNLNCVFHGLTRKHAPKRCTVRHRRLRARNQGK
jgi:hypothetical protein